MPILLVNHQYRLRITRKLEANHMDYHVYFLIIFKIFKTIIEKIFLVSADKNQSDSR